MKEKVLIVGGTGAIGKNLIHFLQNKGFEVSILSRSVKHFEGINCYIWDVNKDTIDISCFIGVSHIIQLSGANISDKRWTSKRKIEIEKSRIESTKLLFKSIRNNNFQIKTFISASAIGYYGATTDEHLYTENDKPGTDFLANVCFKWEKAAFACKSLGIRVVTIRTGIVLMPNEGVISKLLTPAKFGLATGFGSGKQFFPWIHIDDLCGIYHKAIIDSNILDSYNAVAPSENTNNQFIKALCKSIKMPRILPNIPVFILKLIFGELSNVIINGSKISAKKIQESGYTFSYNDIEKAIHNIIQKQ